MSVEQSNETLADFHPVIQRPAFPAEWRQSLELKGIQEYDDALATLAAITPDQSWGCRIDRCDAPWYEGEPRFTVYVPSEVDATIYALAEDFLPMLRGNKADELGISDEDLEEYITTLIRYWQDVRTLRTEFVRWLHESKIEFTLVPCNRSFGGNYPRPYSDVIVASENDVMRIKLAGMEFEPRDY